MQALAHGVAVALLRPWRRHVRLALRVAVAQLAVAVAVPARLGGVDAAGEAAGEARALVAQVAARVDAVPVHEGFTAVEAWRWRRRDLLAVAAATTMSVVRAGWR